MKLDPVPPTDIDDYISTFPEAIQGKLQEIRAAVREAAPEAEEAIKYQMPTFVLHGNLVHFAAFKKHIGFYPAPWECEEFREVLSAFKGGKGTVQLPLDQPVPVELIRRIVRFQAEQNLARAATRGKSKRP